jgi:DNA-binding Lrp family transcriptional regulator
MVTGMILLTVEHDKISAVAQEVVKFDGISEVYSVGGRCDLVVIVRARDNEQLAELVTDRLLKVKGITGSETMIAFKVYSRHDLERMFSIGAED